MESDRKERNLKYYQKNSYAIKLARRMKYKKDKKKILQDRKEYYQNNREKIIARVLSYNNNNKEKIADGHRVRYQRRKLKEAKRLVSKLRWEIKNKERRKQMAKEYYRKNKADIINSKRLRRHVLKNTAENPHVKVAQMPRSCPTIIRQAWGTPGPLSLTKKTNYAKL